MKPLFTRIAFAAVITLYLFATPSLIRAQVCDPAGNVIIYSNYEGGTLNINVNENIPNLKLGIVTYESPVVNISGPFAGNITEVIYAGFGGNGSCTGNTTVQINGVDPSIVTIYTNAQPAISPYLGDPIFTGSPPLVNCMTSGGDCSTSSAGGGNSANQIVQFFLFEFAAPAVFRYHSTQYDCWANESANVTAAGNCCISAPTTPLNPIYQPGATYDLIPETEFSLCGGSVTITIPYEVLFQPPIYPGYIWSSGATGASVTFTQPGTYSVTAGDYCHFGANTLLEDQITITPCSDELFVITTPAQISCPNTSVSIGANASGGIGPYIFDWTPNIGAGPGPFTVSPTITTTYTVEVIDAAGASATASITVTVNTLTVSVNLGPDTDLCNGTVVLNATSAGATAYSWNTGQSTPSITVANPGTFSVTVSGPCNTATDQITVGVCIPPLIVSLGDDIVACSGQPFTIQATASGGTPPYTYSWSPSITNGPGPYTQTVNANTTYIVTVTDANGTIAADQLNVSIGASEVTVNLGPDRELCLGINNELDAFGPNIISYLWSNGAASESIAPTVGGLFWVTVTGACNTDTDSIEVAIVPSGLPEFAREVQICEGNEVLIGIVLPDSYLVVWFNGEIGSQITVDESGLYTANVVNTCGASTFSVEVETINCACDIFVPNAFTPDDNNGINDLFGPVSECDFSEYDFVIFNRWGQLVFRTNNPNKKWNGASTDEAFWGQNMAYVWFLKARQRPGLLVTGPIELNGMVTVIR